MSATTKQSRWVAEEVTGFDVTCVVGHVDLTHEAIGVSPYEAAMRLIAQHGAPGDYSFPLPDGGRAMVSIDFGEPRVID